MPFTRALVSWRQVSNINEDAMTNTLYFNVSGSVDDPDYADLASDLAEIYGAESWTFGREITVRFYDMADPEPRAPKAVHVRTATGTVQSAWVPQAALALSYFADRNLPRQRGRIFTGPYTGGTNGQPSGTQRNDLLDFGEAIAGLGGLNVDWSLWSPTTQTHTRLSKIRVDDSFDVIRSRKRPTTNWAERTING